MNSRPTRLYLIRHGEVEERYHRIFGGSRIDMELSPKGHSQADALAGWLEHHPLDAIYTSPMTRVQQTLAPLRRRRASVPVEIIPNLREVDFGDWTGHNWYEVRDRFGTSAFQWLDELDRGTIPNGETGTALQARIRPSIEKILESHQRQNVAIYCHGGIVRMILSILLELPLPKFAHFEIDYASTTLVELTPERNHRPEVQLLNFAPWRDLPARPI